MRKTTLSERIERDLRHRIVSGNRPRCLTLGALAAEYGVSHMPVREALAALTEEKLLVRQRKGGRLSVDEEVAANLAYTVDQIQEPVDWETELADEIVRLSLAGHDDYVREEATAERFGVARSTVRGAFLRLSSRGMIEHVPRCGWRVRSFRLEDMYAYLEVREVLERKALELARPRLIAGELKLLLDRNSPTPDGQAQLDDSVHAYWIERAGNRYITEFFDRNAAFYWAVFRYAAIADEHEADKSAEHRAILDALLAGDFARADRALADHIRGQRPTLLHVIDTLDARLRLA